jgi:RecJ-like exonuclease
MSQAIEDAIFGLLAEREAGKSIDPSEAARVVDAEAWRRLLPQVRATAVGLARQGRLVILRHGRPVDPDGFRGVYRLRSP